MICKLKKKRKSTTIIEGYEGSDEDLKLAKEIKPS
jgi:translation initiation factor 1 (eIF-1/SUI1)